MDRLLSRRDLLSLSAAGSAYLVMRPTGRAGAIAGSFPDRLTAGPPDVAATYRAGAVELDLAGRVVTTVAYNGSVPGPTLRARAGDVVEVTVENGLDEATSIHWHGLAIDNAMDGVPGLTQEDILPGTSFTYRFRVPDAGTYWFHPHHGLQLEHGLYAPFIIGAPGNEDEAADAEYVVVLDDWLDGLGLTPKEELERIRQMGADMGSGGHDMSMMATSPLLGGDAGDAVYPAHLINGRPIDDPPTLDPQPRGGDRVRLRFINAGGDTAYRVAIGGHRMTITHTDGFPVEPVEVDAFIIGMGERYDVVVEVRDGAWPVIALAEGKDARAAAILRTRGTEATTAPDLMADVDELDGQWLRYADLRAASDVALDPRGELRRQHIALTGDMVKFDWGFDGRAYGDHEPIEVDEGEWVVLEIENTTSMWHPIHLHGHTPQLGPTGGARKDTVNILPNNSIELLFQATNPGQWMLHCHNAYHLEAGMATVLSYRGS
jgi:FtsP/CotA-like multicopper oxidase with cupredoxin domain